MEKIEDISYTLQEAIEEIIDNFCEECDEMEIDNEPHDCMGAQCIRKVVICELGGSKCNRRKEYDRLLKLKMRIDSVIEIIEKVAS